MNQIEWFLPQYLSKIFLNVSCLILFSGCTPEETNVEKTVATFYHSYISNSIIDTQLLTVDLSNKLYSVDAEEKKDAQRLKNLNSTDKPDMIEGDIFSSLYEGPDSFHIKSTTVSGKKATVNIEFTNTHDEVFKWEDDIMLFKTADGWKIDNVIYKMKEANEKSTKQVLIEFLSTSATD